uniref:Uncharacterized protein n=1 Tax=Micrurus spixii TaxID=129469 RepID=A0A2D4MY54_9SAUR
MTMSFATIQKAGLCSSLAAMAIQNLNLQVQAWQWPGSLPVGPELCRRPKGKLTRKRCCRGDLKNRSVTDPSGTPAPFHSRGMHQQGLGRYPGYPPGRVRQPAYQIPFCFSYRSIKRIQGLEVL